MSSQINLSNLRKKSIKIDQLLLENSMFMKERAKSNSSKQEIVLDSDLNAVFRNIEFLKIPSQIFNPHRILILFALKKFRELDFSSLRELAGIRSDGNLANHLRVLEDVKMINVGKEFVGRRPKTFYELTDNGKIQVDKLSNYLYNFLDVGDAK